MIRFAEIVCAEHFKKGQITNVFLEGALAIVKILSNVQYSHWGNFYKCEIMEWPALKRYK